MNDEELEKRLKEIEKRLRELEKRFVYLDRRQRSLHNQVLRLAAIEMAVTEVLQKHGQIKPGKFEEQVERFVGSLDQEISEKKTGRFLDRIWREFEGKD